MALIDPVITGAVVAVVAGIGILHKAGIIRLPMSRDKNNNNNNNSLKVSSVTCKNNHDKIDLKHEKVNDYLKNLNDIQIEQNTIIKGHTESLKEGRKHFKEITKSLAGMDTSLKVFAAKAKMEIDHD